MPISLTHAYTSPVPDVDYPSDLVKPSDWNAEHDIIMAQDRVIGRVSSGAGAAEELPFGTVASSLVFATAAAVRLATTVTYGGGYIYLRGYFAADDYDDGIVRGGGWYWYDASDVTTLEANDPTVIVDSSSRRWKLQHRGVVTTGQCGIYSDGLTDDLAAWNRLIALLNTNTSGIYSVRIDAGRMMLSDNPNAITADDIEFFGLSNTSSVMAFLAAATDKGRFFQLGTLSGNPANDISIRNIGFYNDENELTLTGADAAIDVMWANDTLIEDCFFYDVAKAIKLGDDDADAHARKTRIVKNVVEASPKPACDMIIAIHSTGTLMLGNRMSQRAKRYGLHYDAQTANFVIGQTVTGGTSGATATIVNDVDAGATGTLWINAVTGDFQDGETITSATGSATTNIPAGLKALAYESRAIKIAAGASSTGIDSFHVTANEINWNNADLEHLVEIDVTLKGVSNLYFTGANVLDGGSIANFWIRLDSGAGATANKRLHNMIVNGNRITANGSGDGSVGVACKLTQYSDNLLSGIVFSGNDIIGRGALDADNAGASDGYVQMTFCGNNIINAAEMSNPNHTDGGDVFTFSMSGISITGNNVHHQDENNTYRFARFLVTETQAPKSFLCVGNLIHEVSGAVAIDCSSLGPSDPANTVIRNNAGKSNPAIRSVQTTNATVTNLATQTLADGYSYRVAGRVVGVESGGGNRAAYSFVALFSATGGAATLAAATVTVEHESDVAWDVTIDASGATARVRVTGKAATTINWGLFDFNLEVQP